MRSCRSTDFSSKKDFAAALNSFTHFDLIRAGEFELLGDWSADRSARGENTVTNLYMMAAGLLADKDFNCFLAAAGHMLSDREQKYYAFWRSENGTKYYLFKNMSTSAKFELLWDWARIMGVELELCCGIAENAAEGAETAFDWIELPDASDEALKGKNAPRLIHAHAPRNCSFGSRGGRMMIYDDVAERFVSLPYDDTAGELGEITEYEGLDSYGWKYRTEENGRWGYLSPDFAQVISPRFDEVLLRSADLQAILGESNIIAWSRDQNRPDSLADLDLWFSDDLYGGTRLCCLAELLKASAQGGICSFLGYLPQDFEESMSKATLFLSGRFAVGGGFRCLLRADPLYLFLYEDSEEAVHMERIHDDVEGLRIGNGTYPLLKWDLTLDSCMDALASPVKYEKLNYLSSAFHGSVRYWAEKKDGLWGVFKVSEIIHGGNEQKEAECHIDALLEHPQIQTPYAFTAIEPLSGSLCLIDRFGQKGIYDLEKDRYTIPCEYDSITIEGSTLTVRHFDLVGEMETDGHWIKQMHREER